MFGATSEHVRGRDRLASIELPIGVFGAELEWLAHANSEGLHASPLHRAVVAKRREPSTRERSRRAHFRLC